MRREEPAPLAWKSVERCTEATVATQADGSGVRRVCPPERRARRRMRVGQPGSTGAVPVKAPMPGRIVRVLVGVGDRVAAVSLWSSSKP